MCPYDKYPEDFDDSEDFAYRRSQALDKLVKEAHREERHRNRHRSFSKDRHHRDGGDWEDDDWDSYDDGSTYEYYEDLNSHY